MKRGKLEQLTAVANVGRSDDEVSPRRRALMVRFAYLWLASVVTTLLATEAVFAICPCGDGICGPTCIPPETPNSCPADCGSGLPAELTVRMFVVPVPDPGLFDVHIDDTTLATNMPHAGTTGPHTVAPGPHTLSVSAGAGTVAKYRTTICGACSAGGAIQPGARQSCSITNLRFPTPAPAPGCATECVSELMQCGAAGEPVEFCTDVFNRCLNGCQIPPAGRLTIARYNRPGMPSVDLSEEVADLMLASMSDVLRALDASDDFDCNVAFCRDATIGTYGIGDGIVDSEAELDEILDSPHDVKVARGINICDGRMGLFAGCAGEGRSLVVDRSPASAVQMLGIVVAHEYGHVRGLRHRDPDIDPNALMTWGGASFDSRKVNVRECAAFRSGVPAAGVSIPGPASAAAATTATAPRANIRDFVRQFFIHGIPYEDTMSYGSQVVPTLLDMLADPKEDRAWKNIVIVLGMLGDERAVAPLISLIEQSAGGEISHSQYDAKRAALLGLGYLANKDGNQRALNYLLGGLTPSVWPQRGITWTSPDHQTATERNSELSRLAIIGLGLSGAPSAEDALRKLRAPATTATETAFREQMSGVISEALKANQIIADEGLAEYYRAATP
jgi:hypothetical protein